MGRRTVEHILAFDDNDSVLGYAGDDGRPAYATVAVFRLTDDFTPWDGQHIAQLAEDNLVPMLRALPGFRSFQLIAVGGPEPRTAVAVSQWDTSDQGEAGREQAERWTEGKVARWITAVTTYEGHIVVSS
jgi:heme-degrading monooxygenase HmoA